MHQRVSMKVAHCSHFFFCSSKSSSSSSSSSSLPSPATCLPQYLQDGVMITEVTSASRLGNSLFETDRRCRTDMTVSALTLILVLVSSCVLPVFGLTSVVPEISEFSGGDRRLFTDASNTQTFFHHLYIDPQNASSVYVGALDFVYRLNGGNINTTFKRSENITNFSNFTTIYLQAVELCRNSYVQKSRPDYQCRNHIRGILPNFNDRELYICSTGSYSPQDFYLDTRTLKVLRIGYDARGLDGAGSGITKCPYDPDTNHTIIYVGPNAGTPNNLSAIYSSLLVGAGYEFAIYRSALQSHPHSAVEFSPLRSKNEPAVAESFYIASFEIDRYVYFFFREYVTEPSSSNYKHYARVARVCKNDKGSTFERKQFLTYVKARLNCSVGTDDIPVYFNELYDVHYDSENRVFYCLFMANVNAMWGSAVCQFDYSTIESKFDDDPFYSQEMTITPQSEVPDPRPSLCKSDTQSLSITIQSFALSHTLMYGTVDQMTRSPLFYTRDAAYSHLTVDFVQQFTILYLYSFTNPLEIVRVVSWSDEDEIVRFRKFSILKPFSSGSSLSNVWDMKIHAVNGRKWLYVVTESTVIQLSVELCSSYNTCTDCVKDPYCGWNAYTLRCEDFRQQESSYLVQGVTDASSLSVCRSSCTVRTESRALPGAAIHLSCLSRCSPEAAVVWTWQRSGSSNPARVPVFSDPNYVLSWNNGLVILNVSRYHIGTFRCLSEGVVLAEHSVTTSACEYGEDVREIWIREFVSWCKAFDQYQSEYNMWLCLKDKCLRSSCVSQDIIDGCRKRQLT